VNSRGDGTLFDRTEFTYQPESDTFLCPAGQTLARKQLMRKDRAVLYAAQPEVCGACPLKSRCTVSAEVDSSKVNAMLKDGILKIELPKAAHAKAVRIEPKTA
jgi:hypothetical protein